MTGRLKIILLFVVGIQLVAVHSLFAEQVASMLYLSPQYETQKRPVVFMLGGSEGANRFGDEYRQLLQDQGFHVVSIAYFGAPGTPDQLSRIDVDAIAETVREYRDDPHIDADRMALFGVSKGGELALLLASLFDQWRVVITAVPSHVVFQASEITLFRHSSWLHEGSEVAFVPYPRFSMATIKGIFSGDAYAYLDMHREALQNIQAVQNASIVVENSHAALLLLSGTQDGVWPSTPMCEAVVARLERTNYAYPVKHIALDAGHFVLDEPESWREIEAFLKQYL